MLSVLIPTYNYDCHALVRDLHEQAAALHLPYEIVVADDHSPDEASKEANRRINELPCCRYVELHRNMGRAQIRNYLADSARYEWLLFIDSDAQVCSPTYIEDYIEAARWAPVVCGGLRTPPRLPSPGCSLRYTYEKRADKRRTARWRERAPYSQFTTFNFLVRRDVFLGIRFDERLLNYGVEDALFGCELKRRGTKIMHIDNPLVHLGIEPNEEFLEKTQTALMNLQRVKGQMREASPLLRATALLERLHLKKTAARLWQRHQEQLWRNLTGRHPSLTLFALYKLGYYCELEVFTEGEKKE